MQRMTALQTQVTAWRTLAEEIRDASEMAELARDDSSIVEELSGDVAALRERLDQMEFDLMLAGPHDAANAILAIHAGAGGTESQDWADMLLRMYLRWAEIAGLAGGDRRSHRGRRSGHQERDRRDSRRLCLRLREGRARRSPARAHLALRRGKRRHTSFALVEVLPEIEDDSGNRHQRRRHPGRYLPRLRGGRPARQQDEQRHPHHAHADRDRRHLPERAVADARTARRR